MLDYSDKLPTGRYDLDAKNKLVGEISEFTQALADSDRLGAFTELADLVYYGIKCLFNGLANEREIIDVIVSACRILGCSPTDAFAVAQIKYQLRAITVGTKNDTEERKAVAKRVDAAIASNRNFQLSESQ